MWEEVLTLVWPESECGLARLRSGAGGGALSAAEDMGQPGNSGSSGVVSSLGNSSSVRSGDAGTKPGIGSRPGAEAGAGYGNRVNQYHRLQVHVADFFVDGGKGCAGKL